MEMPALDGVEHTYIDANGLTMHVAIAGEGDPIVLLHGWPQNWFAYRHLIPELARDYRVICPDLRGWGWTDAPPDGYGKRQLMQDVIALLDAMEIEQTRLVGHDWGSIIGFMLCVERPERVSKYLALGGSHLWPRIDLKATLAMRHFWYQAAIATPGMGQWLVQKPGFIRLLYRVWSAKQGVWTDEDLHALIDQFKDPKRARATVLVYRTWITKELLRMIAGGFRKKRLQTPTLFLHGQDDGCIDPVFTRGNIPNLTVELLPGVGHFVAEEAPQLVLEKALAHFK